MTTPKMKNYALALLSKHGYSTEYMNSQFKDFNAGMRDRSGRVSDWLDEYSHAKAVIEALKDRKED